MTIEFPLSRVILFVAGTSAGYLVMALSATVYFYNRKYHVNRVFSIYVLLLSAWMILGGFNVFIPLWETRIALFQMMLSAFSGALFFLFSRSLADTKKPFRRYDVLWFLPPLFIAFHNGVAIAAPEMPYLFSHSVSIVGLKLYLEPGALYYIHFFTVLAGHAAGGAVVISASRRETNRLYKKRNNILLLALLTVSVGSFATYHIFVLTGLPAPVLLLHPLLAVTMIIAGYSLLATRAWKLEQLLEIIKTDEKLLRNQIDEIKQISCTDPLTRIYNRNMLYDELDNAISRALRYNEPFSIIIFDIDYFKAVNDRYGHLTGDDVLVELTGIVKPLLRKNDLFARWGGEEFIVLAPHTTLWGAKDLAEKIRKRIYRHAFATIGRLSCSFGVCQFDTTCTQKELIKRADNALYRAKTQGRNRICLHIGESEFMTAENDEWVPPAHNKKASA